ncbi:lipopolysaccharide assembly protein LapB [Prevotella sp. HUN102]|uniref:tetratricopeptide repeat protein n=1 Tax=Prevotella sp. HUN102 TaxID=1392486 RepID=UPI00048DCFC9|nr:tetratricopeptide repeat protein [Prevotella sp. HUN102]
MNFFQKLFGGKEENKEETKAASEAKDFEVLKYDGVRAMKSGENDYALRCFKHALELQEDYEIRDYLSIVYARTGQLSEAYEQLLKLSEVQPDNQQIFIRMANIAYMMEDYGIMSNACEKALLIDKENPEVSYLYAQATKGQGDDVNTVAMATKAISLNDSYGDAYLLRGETLLRMQQLEEADADAQWLLEHTEDNEDVLLLKARIERARNNAPLALEYFSKVIDASPFSIAAFRERGLLYEETGETDKAKEDLEKADELQRDAEVLTGNR